MESAVSNLNHAATVRAGFRNSSARSFPCFIRISLRSESQRCAVRCAAGGGGEETEKLPDQLQPPRRISQASRVGLWEKFPTARAVQQMIETMERIMEDPFAYSGTSFPSLDGGDGVTGYRRGRTPWEIKEGAAEYNMRFDMPGMSKDDVKVWVEGNMLVVKAEKKPLNGDINGGGAEKAWSAKSYGRYNSRVLLPENTLAEKMQSRVEDGVLYIVIPKASPGS